MFGSTIIDVAIGLIFVFFLLSVIASYINDFVSALLEWRSKDLENGVRALLSDPDLADKVWNHPLVQGLKGKEGKRPTHIPPNTFALAVFDALVPGGNNPSALQTVRTRALSLPESSARQALVSIIDAANGDVNKARSQVEDWFNAGMDHVSAVYKRRMTYLTMFVALAVSLIFGADTLAIGNGLWQEPALRAAVAGVASNQAPPSSAAGNLAVASTSGNNLQETIKTLSQVSLPLGWTKLPQTAGDWIQKVLGLLMTTLAVSMGAPFWYQLLRTLSSARSAVESSGQKG